MVKIDTKVIKELNDFLYALLNKHEEATVDLFNVIKHTSEFWHAEQSDLFQSQLAIEKQITNNLKNNLNQRLKIYQYIYNAYSKFGKTLTCDYQKKEAILKKIDFSIEQLDGAINRFRTLDISFSFSERSSIQNHLRRLTQLKIKMLNYQNKLRTFLEKVEKIEQEVRRKVQLLEEMVVEPFVFD